MRAIRKDFSTEKVLYLFNKYRATKKVYTKYIIPCANLSGASILGISLPGSRLANNKSMVQATTGKLRLSGEVLGTYQVFVVIRAHQAIPL